MTTRTHVYRKGLIFLTEKMYQALILASRCYKRKDGSFTYGHMRAVFVTAKVSTSFLFSNTNVIYPSIAFMAILGVFFLFFSLSFTIYNKSIFLFMY